MWLLFIYLRKYSDFLSVSDSQTRSIIMASGKDWKMKEWGNYKLNYELLKYWEFINVTFLKKDHRYASVKESSTIILHFRNKMEKLKIAYVEYEVIPNY